MSYAWVTAMRKGRLDDSPAREAALDPARSFIVQAPAGSGKTDLLTRRYLRLLARVDAPEQIVAITFTLKAAAQLRRRIMQALASDAAAGAEDDYARSLRELATAARQHAAERDWQLELHPARLRIQTIDAFCHGLAAQLPILARAGSELRVTARPLPLYAEAAQRTLAHINSDAPVARAVAVLLRHRDNRLEQTQELLIDMLARRDHWLRHIVRVSGEHLRARLERDLAEQIELALRELQREWSAEQLERVTRLAAFAARRLDPGQPLLAAWRGAEGKLEPTLPHLARWRDLASLLLTNAGDWRKTVNKNQGFPPEARQQKDDLLALLGELERNDALRARLSEARLLPPPRMSDAQWEVAAALLELLKVAAAELELVFRARGQVDFAAIAHAAARALGTAEQPGELALALDLRIRHLLVDEFQDTSYAQIELLEALTAGWTAGDGRTVFCVGDPMQSIYRFREAEVGLFLRTRDRGLSTVGLEPLTLHRNFRSNATLVEWCNDVFARVLPERDDLARGAVRHVPSAAARAASGGPAVFVHCAFANDPAAEGAAIAELVAARRRFASQQRIAILVRQRNHAAHVVLALRALGVSYQAVELEVLASQTVVRDLMALLAALTHLGDRAAWLAVLRSPVCGLLLADLEALTRDSRDALCWELLHDEACLARMTADGRRRAESVRAVLAAALAGLGRTSLRTLLERTWVSLGGPAGALDARALDDAQAFLDQLETLETEGEYAGVSSLAHATVELYARPDASADPHVQIMTVHKAKGLEFDIVILPGLGRGNQRPDNPPLLRWLEVPRESGDPALLLAAIERKGSDTEPLVQYLKARDSERDLLERGRLLYVAATRAAEELHLFGHVRTKGAGNEATLARPEGQLALLWPALAPVFEARFNERDPQMSLLELPAESWPRFRRFEAGWSLPALPADVSWPGRTRVTAELEAEPISFDWVSETGRRIGTVVHAELERWSRHGAPQSTELERSRSRFVRLLQAAGVPPEHVGRATERVLRALERTLVTPRGRWLLAEEHRDAQAELRLTGVLDGELVAGAIDRTFVDTDGVRWIVDYKTSAHEGPDRDAFLDQELERYRPQLERYARLGALLWREPLRVGLYFPLLDGWREWAP